MITASIVHASILNTRRTRPKLSAPRGSITIAERPTVLGKLLRCRSHAPVADNKFPHLVLCIPYMVFPCYFVVTMLMSTPQWVNMVRTPSLHESTLLCDICETTVADSRRKHLVVVCGFNPTVPVSTVCSSCRKSAPVRGFKITKRW